MSRVPWVLCIAAVMATLAASTTALGDSATWDAYSDFRSDQNTPSDTWQYLYSGTQNGGDNTLPYVNFSQYGTTAFGKDGWSEGTDWHFIGKDASVNPAGLFVHPFYPEGFPPKISAIGWLSPITGVVNVDFSVTDLNVGDVAVDDGVSYFLFKAAETTPLASGTIDRGGATGTISVTDVSIATGEILYLQIGSNARFDCDLTGVAFTVTAVPEPASLILAGCGAIGLLAYAWRKRK